MAEVFISYRREDSQHAAGRLLATLRDRFGRDNVFMDVTTIKPGAPFPDAIDSGIQRCHVFLAVLGARWLTIFEQRQQESSVDHVRAETAAALQRPILVIPVLIDDATLPSAVQLPADISDLAARNAQRLRHTSWESDAPRLIAAIDERLAASPGAGESTWQEWRQQARRAITRAFADRVFEKFHPFWPEWKTSGLPPTVDQSLSKSPPSAGRASCESLLLLANEMSCLLREQEVVLTAVDSQRAQQRLKTALGCAARLCLDPVVRSRLRPAGSDAGKCRLSAPAKEIAGSMLIHREKPEITWALPQAEGGAPLEDDAAIPITVETGDEASTRQKLAQALHASFYPSVKVPAHIDEDTQDRLRGANQVATLLGENRYLVFDGRNESALTSTLEEWISRELGTDILVLLGARSSPQLFLYDETTLITLIARFLRMLSAPEWNPR